MLRLSEALAKLHFSSTIEVVHAAEAYNLMKTSIVTIDREREEMDELDDLNVEKFDEMVVESQGVDMQTDQPEVKNIITITKPNNLLFTITYEYPFFYPL